MSEIDTSTTNAEMHLDAAEDVIQNYAQDNREVPGIKVLRLVLAERDALKEVLESEGDVATIAHLQGFGQAREEIRTLTAEVARLREAQPSVQCYWDADDREMGWREPWEILETSDWGTISEIEHVAVVERTFEALLPAAEDSDSDDEFHVCEQTREAAEMKISAEIKRRAALKGTDS